jgi:diguanylate cyclase (GGDEF)-like protein/PAS domain S-box-containing protein
MNNKKPIRTRHTYLQLVMIAVVVLSLMAYSYFSSTRMLSFYAPLVQAIEEIRLQTTTAHLWVDEILMGYSDHNMDEVSWLLDEADWYAQAILEGGKDSKTEYIPVYDPSLRLQIQELRDKLGTLREITEERYELDISTDQKSGQEKYYDEFFYELLDLAEEVGEQAHKFINKEITVYQSAQGILATIIILLFILAGILFHRHQFRLREHARLLENEIFERKQAEHALKKSENMLSKVFNTTPDSVVISRLTDGRLMYVNSTFTKLMQYTAEEALGKTISELNFWVDRDKKKTLEKQLEKEGKVNDFETDLRTKGNHILPVSLSASFIELEGEKCVVSMVHDITERKRASEEIKRNYNEQQALAEIMHISLQPVSLNEMLSRSLYVLLASPSFSVLRKGAIFLVNKDMDTLKLEVNRGFSESQQMSCARLPFGKCLCGQAAEKCETIFTNHLDENHDINYDGMKQHGHYCVPILSGDHLIGVFNTYVEAGYTRKEDDVIFLKSAANILALAIVNKEAEEALRFTQFSVEHTGDALFWIKPDGCFTYINDAALSSLGYSHDDMMSMSVMDIDPDFNEEDWHQSWVDLKKKGSLLLESTHRRKDGSTFPVEIKANYLEYDGKQYDFAFVHDITERKKAEEELQTSHESLTAILNSMDSLVYIADMNTYEVLFLNEYGKKTFGNHVGKNCWEILQTNQSEPCEFCTNEHLIDTDGNSTGIHIWEFQNTMNNRWYECRDQAVRWFDGRLVRMEIATDITDRKQDEETIKHMAHHDLLTGLPNRILFMDRLEQAIARSRRDKSMMAVMFLDLDKFKPINDSMGHSTGDLILKKISEKLTSCMRETDTVARFGGDEFIALITDLKDTNTSTQMARKLGSIIAEPITLGANEFSLGVSIGIALYPEHADTTEKLISMADEAMYMAKGDISKDYLYATSKN